MTHESRIRAHLESGATGTQREISEALGISAPAVFAVLQRLLGECRVCVVDRRKPERCKGSTHRRIAVWGAPVPAKTVPLMQAALASRGALEVAWHAGAS